MTTAILLAATACFWISADDHEALVAELGGPDLDTAADASCLVEWYPDADGDGYGWPESSVTACERPEGFAVYATDCDDTDAAVNPAAAEHCNTTDDDCDGNVDESDAADASTWFADADVNPGAAEVCDGVDNDCDEAVDVRDLAVAPESTTTFARDADGIWIYEADILATNVTISGNAASDDGGGLYMQHWTAVFTDTSVSGNTATRGGGAFVAPDNNATAAVECYGSSGLAAGFWATTPVAKEGASTCTAPRALKTTTCSPTPATGSVRPTIHPTTFTPSTHRVRPSSATTATTRRSPATS